MMETLFCFARSLKNPGGGAVSQALKTEEVASDRLHYAARHSNSRQGSASAFPNTALFLNFHQLNVQFVTSVTLDLQL